MGRSPCCVFSLPRPETWPRRAALIKADPLHDPRGLLGPGGHGERLRPGSMDGRPSVRGRARTRVGRAAGCPAACPRGAVAGETGVGSDRRESHWNAAAGARAEGAKGRAAGAARGGRGAPPGASVPRPRAPRRRRPRPRPRRPRPRAAVAAAGLLAAVLACSAAAAAPAPERSTAATALPPPATCPGIVDGACTWECQVGGGHSSCTVAAARRAAAKAGRDRWRPALAPACCGPGGAALEAPRGWARLQSNAGRADAKQ
jgi:hypothetical protein